MSKRFTDTEKWGKEWFTDLPAEMKCAWSYFCDNCDLAGILDINRKLVEFAVGSQINWEAFRGQLGERVEDIPGENKVWLTGYCEFQYGALSSRSHRHRAVFRRLHQFGLSDRVKLKETASLEEFLDFYQREYYGLDVPIVEWQRIRLNVLRNARLICVYCEEDCSERPTVDHKVPVSRGGKSVPENLAVACHRCNSSKNDKLLSEWAGRPQ